MLTSLTCFKHRFTPKWPMVLLTLAVLTLLIYLGCWQLQRAAEKKHLLQAQAQLARLAPSLWRPGMSLPKQYQPLTVTGVYLPMTLLMDNQHYQHQLGYQVLTPLLMKDDSLILIDRGWIAGDTNRQNMPVIASLSEKATISGQAYFPSSKGFLLGAPVEKKSEALMIIERIDPKLFSQLLHKSVYPFIIRLDNKQAHGFIRDWPVVSMPPERHYAYALQWFAMALVVLILFIVLNWQKENEHNDA